MFKVRVHDLNPKLHATFIFLIMRIYKYSCKKRKLHVRNRKLRAKRSKLHVIFKSSVHIIKVACTK